MVKVIAAAHSYKILIVLIQQEVGPIRFCYIHQGASINESDGESIEELVQLEKAWSFGGGYINLILILGVCIGAELIARRGKVLAEAA